MKLQDPVLGGIQRRHLTRRLRIGLAARAHTDQCLTTQSLALGRPPAIHLSYVDCEFPEDEESSRTDLGELRPGSTCPFSFSRTPADGLFSLALEILLLARHMDAPRGGDSGCQASWIRYRA